MHERGKEDETAENAGGDVAGISEAGSVILDENEVITLLRFNSELPPSPEKVELIERAKYLAEEEGFLELSDVYVTELRKPGDCIKARYHQFTGDCVRQCLSPFSTVSPIASIPLPYRPPMPTSRWSSRTGQR